MARGLPYALGIALMRGSVMLFTVIVFDADERGGYLTIILMRQYRKAQARFGKPGGSHLFSFSSALIMIGNHHLH